VKPSTRPPTREKTPMERLADLTRRIVAVPRAELAAKRKAVRKRLRER